LARLGFLQPIHHYDPPPTTKMPRALLGII
jgi:hypothetical protein